MNETLEAIKNGAIGGAVATGAMTGVMSAVHVATGSHKEIAPKRITVNALARLGLHDDVDEDTRHVLTIVSHWAYGMGCGAIFGAVRKWSKLRLPGVLQGAVFGLVVWAVSYMGWVPAVGLLPPVWNQDPARRRELLLAHIVFGATLGATFDRLAGEQ
jgi:uncharacterized membrane protein YagU involved in acid resistance